MLAPRRPDPPGDHVGRKAHEEGPDEGADLLGGSPAPPLLLLQTAFPHTAGRQEQVTRGSLPVPGLYSQRRRSLEGGSWAMQPEDRAKTCLAGCVTSPSLRAVLCKARMAIE